MINENDALKEIPQSIFNQETNLLRSPVVGVNNNLSSSAKQRYQQHDHTIPPNTLFASEKADPQQQLGAYQMVITKQNLEIKRLKQQIVFMKMQSLLLQKSPYPPPSLNEEQQLRFTKAADLEGKFATPKKRKLLDEMDHQESENIPIQPMFASPDNKNKRIPSTYPPKQQMQQQQHQQQHSSSLPPKTGPSFESDMSPPSNINFKDLSNLLDGMEDDQNQEKGKNIQATSFHQQYRYLGGRANQRNSIMQETVSNGRGNLTNDSPHSMGKKSNFLSNITRQYGPVSMAELPAYKEKINSWKNKYS